MEDYDVLRGIFSSRLGMQQLTSRALEAEMRGDYQTAAKLYTEIKAIYKIWGPQN